MSCPENWKAFTYSDLEADKGTLSYTRGSYEAGGQDY
jgi:hypothetical protein